MYTYLFTKIFYYPRVTKMPPCDLLAITAWEQRYSTQLPENIRDFYLASDGFRLSWSYNYAGQLLPLGSMTLNRVADLRRVGGLRYNFDTEQPTLLDIESVDCVTEEKRNSSGFSVSIK